MRLRLVVIEMRHGRQIKVQTLGSADWQTVGKIQVGGDQAPLFLAMLKAGADRMDIPCEIKQVARARAVGP